MKVMRGKETRRMKRVMKRSKKTITIRKKVLKWMEGKDSPPHIKRKKIS